MRWVFRLPHELKEQPVKSIFRAALLASTVILLPFFLLSGMNEYFAEQEKNRLISSQQNEMSQILARVSNRSEPEKLFSDEFDALTSHPYPGDTFSRRLGQLTQKYKRAIELYIFDENGKCLNIPGFSAPPKYAAQKFLESIKEPETIKKNERFLIQLSGYRQACKAIAAAPGRIISIGTSHDRHWGGYFKLSGKNGHSSGSLLVFIRKSGLDFDELLHSAVNDANAKSGKHYWFGLHDPVNPEKIVPEKPEFNIDFIETIKKIPIGGTFFSFAGKTGVRLVTNRGIALIACSARPVEISEAYSMTGMFFNVVSFISWLILLPVFSGITFWQPGLRFRLSAIFLFGASIPLILLVFTGIADRVEKEKVLINEYQIKNLNELTRIDEGMLFEYRRLENLFKKNIVDRNSLPDDIFRKSMRSSGSDFFSYSNSVRQVLFVGDGWNRSFTLESPKGRPAEKKETMVLYGNMLLEVILGKYEEEKNTGRSSELQSVVNNFGGWLSRGLILSSGRIGLLNVMDSVMPTYIDFFLDSAWNARAIMLLFLSRPGLQREYLLTISKAWENTFKEGNGRPAAFAINSSPDWPAFPSRSFQNLEIAAGMAEQVLRSGIPAHETGLVGGTKYLLSAMPGKHLDGYILFYAQPYKNIEKTLSQLNRRMIFLSLIILFIALISAKIASIFLLGPLHDLKTGLEAVSSGKFRHRMPVSKVEDFSSMFKMLNHTLESFQELQVARNLQSTLWPEKQLSGPGWEMHGRCITATELGGDHYDWIQLQDGRILVMIGDVTGHGIAPAMVQAAMKVWLSLYCEKGLSAAEILIEISRLHFNYGAKRLYMTCWLGLFAPETGAIEFASAGHPYPFVIRQDGNSERLAVQGMPLGIRAKARINSETTVLGSGESIVLYTDGIVETVNNSGIMLGFDGFEKICRQTVKMNAEDSVGHIFSSASSWGPQNDDQTVIILKRNGDLKH